MIREGGNAEEEEIDDDEYGGYLETITLSEHWGSVDEIPNEGFTLGGLHCKFQSLNGQRNNSNSMKC
jgi:hypothetical protein